MEVRTDFVPNLAKTNCVNKITLLIIVNLCIIKYILN